MKLLHTLLLLLAAQLITPLALACGEAETGDPAAKCAAAGNPIDVISGNKFQREVDLPALPGVMGLEVVRYYNSKLSGIGSRTGILGRGWRLSYETTLAAIGDTIQVLEADGTRLIFSRDLLNPSLCSSGDPANGEIDVKRTSRGDEYTWRKTNGQRLSFNAQGRLVQILAPTGEFVSMQHDARGWLVKVTDPQGRSLNLEYLDKKEAARRTRFSGVQHIDTPVGRISYGYGSEMPKGTDPADRRELLANLVKVDLPGGGARRYHYEDPRFPTLMTGISVLAADRSGKPVLQRYASYGYDNNAMAVSSVHAGGVDGIKLDTSIGGQTVLTNSLGQKTVYRFQMLAGENRILDVRGAGCSLCGDTNVRYGYDSLGRMTDVTRLDRKGVSLETAHTDYDHYGRPVKVSRIAYRDGKPQTAQWLQRFAYVPGMAAAPMTIVRPSVVPGREAQVRIRYGAAGEPLEVRESGWAPSADGKDVPQPILRVTAYRYLVRNGRTLLAEIDGPLPNGPHATPEDSDITRIEWERDGNRIVGIVKPGNFRSTITYDGAGRIAGVDDGAGQRTEFSFDSLGQLLAATTDGIRQDMRYDPAGRLLETGMTEEGHYTATARHGYDAAGRKVWTASSLGILSRSQYDTEDRLLETSRESASFRQARSYRYDEAGRVIGVLDNGALRSVRWNARDLPEAIIDALGREQRFGFDEAGRLVAQADAVNTPLTRLTNTTTRYDYDVDGRVGKVIAPNGALTRYVRDDFGQVLAIVSADSGISTRSFDAAGRLVTSTDANGNHGAYQYDVAGRVVRQVISSAHGGEPVVTSWKYEGRRLASVEHPAQSEHYRYDDRGLLASKTVSLRLANGRQTESTTRYRHNALRRLESVSLADGSELVYRRNGQGQVVAVERNRIITPWLRWMLPAQTIVSKLQRDIVGLRHVTYGNGIEGDFQRSKEGTLARIVYLNPKRPAVRTALLDRMPGIASAHAAESPAASRGTHPAPFDVLALLDRRYLWDVQGNLLSSRDANGASTAYAYDPSDRLVAAQARDSLGNMSRAHYFLDGTGNRLLAQEQLAHADTRADDTVKIAYVPATSRSQVAAGGMRADYDNAGQPARHGARVFEWDALGHLSAVSEGGKPLGRYRYNHRGERITKTAGATETAFLYEDRQLTAELDAEGRVTRQYIYLGDQPVALVDSASGAELASVQRSAVGQIFADLGTALRALVGRCDSIAWLHNNHLGAVEVITDEQGRPVWSAGYTPYGRLVRTASGNDGFIFRLRLPGQYQDDETGLYYNDHRYYDPAQGRYLTPDPLGLRGGINSYAYVASNPLKYIDATGLVLFAFDGTGNDESDQKTLSNVVRFRDLYNSGKYFYITGPGTPDPATGIEGGSLLDTGFAFTGKARVNAMIDYLNKYADGEQDDNKAIDIDITGFSRGSAEARDFANQIIAKTKNGIYEYSDKQGTVHCQKLNFRFMGLFDTVLSTHTNEYQLKVGDAFQYVAHAVALNEYRGGAVAFPGESIKDSLTAVAPEGKTRIERGFLGAHSDIGGGFPQQDLAYIALSWMVAQANAAGVTMLDEAYLHTIIADPVIHDKSSNLLNDGTPGPYTEDRDFRYGNGTVVKQRQASIDGMQYDKTTKFIHYLSNPNSRDNISATVDAKAYLAWLNDHGYNINMTVK